MEATAQREIDLHKKVGDELRAIGHPSETVPADQQPVLSEGFQPNDFIPESVQEFIVGKGPETHIKTTHSGKLKRVVDWIRRRKENNYGSNAK